jgi:anti-anti-sigma regulatory factor
MGINLTNFLSSKSKNTRMIDFQDLDHIDGLSISVVVQIYIKITEMIYQCFILEMVLIMPLFIHNQK